MVKETCDHNLIIVTFHSNLATFKWLFAQKEKSKKKKGGAGKNRAGKR